MKLNNSIKLAMANFSLFWKILVYKAFALGIIILFCLPIFNIVKSCLFQAGFFSALTQFLSESVFQNLAEMSANIFSCASTFADGVSILAGTSMFSFFYLGLIVFVVAPFILKLSDIPVSETVYSYMSSLSKNSFTVNFIDSLHQSLGYSLLKTIVEIPFWIIFGAIIYGILSLTTISISLQILCPFLLFIVIVFLLDIKTTILSGWASSVVVFNTCAGKAFKKGIKAVKRKYLSTLSSFAVLLTVTLAIVSLFGIYSFIVIVPMASLISTVFGQVLFFESQGMNYYITPDRIVMPRKLEQADSIRKVKSII